MSPRDKAPAVERTSSHEDAAGEMARYGITRVPADMFHYGEYRYARLSDAVAQARRDADAALNDPR